MNDYHMNGAERGLLSLVRTACWIAGIWLVVRYGILHLPVVQQALTLTLPGGQTLGIGSISLDVAHPVDALAAGMQNYLNQILSQFP